MAKTQTTQTQTTTAVTDGAPAVQVVNTEDFALALMELGNAPPIISYDAVYDMDEKKEDGSLKRMNKRGNPWIGKGLRKFQTGQATVNWASSEEKTEKRGGEYAGTGAWHTAVIVRNGTTPLSVHKEDIETTPPDGNVNARRAIVRLGGLVYKTDKPRLYLRYEMKRAGGDEPRADRKVFTKSVYRLPDGTEVDAAEVKPYLKKKSQRKDETDIQTLSLPNVTRLAINGVIFKVN